MGTEHEQRRIRLTERDGMEGGINCPQCGTYTSFGDIIATGRCRRAWEGGGCEARLAIDLVVEH